MTKTDFVAQFEGRPVAEVLAAAKKNRITLSRKQVHRIRFVLRSRPAGKAKRGRKRKGLTSSEMANTLERATGLLAGASNVNGAFLATDSSGMVHPAIREASAAAGESFRSDPCTLCGHRRDRHIAGEGCKSCASEDPPSYVPDHSFHKRDESIDKRAQLRALILDLGLDTARAVIQDLGASGSSS